MFKHPNVFLVLAKPARDAGRPGYERGVMLPRSNVDINESTVCHINEAADMQPRWLLNQVARELYKNKKEPEGVLLQALQEGRVVGFVMLIQNGLKVDVPPEVWKGIEDVAFNVRRRRKGAWHSQKYRISLEFVVEHATKTIGQALEHLIRGHREEFETFAKSDWLSDLDIAWPSDVEAKVAAQRALMDRLLLITDEAVDGGVVYISKEEALQFIGASVPQKGRGGRRSLDSDRFWVEVVRCLVKNKPGRSREQITSEVREQLDKQNINERRFATWIKDKLKAAYEELGWE
jgi:hypothetical protein